MGCIIFMCDYLKKYFCVLIDEDYEYDKLLNEYYIKSKKNRIAYKSSDNTDNDYVNEGNIDELQYLVIDIKSFHNDYCNDNFYKNDNHYDNYDDCYMSDFLDTSDKKD